jgi:DNA-binding Lrp family transcriptional regulator
MNDLDRYDLRILNELLRDGRQSNQELSRRIGLSAAATWRRLERLSDNGMIKRFTAVLDRARLGYPILALAQVNLTRHNREQTHDFEKAVCAEAQVLACYSITGEGDYQLHIAVESMDGYHRFLDYFLFQIPGVSQVKTSFVLKSIKEETQLPSSSPQSCL